MDHFNLIACNNNKKCTIYLNNGCTVCRFLWVWECNDPCNINFSIEHASINEYPAA